MLGYWCCSALFTCQTCYQVHPLGDGILDNKWKILIMLFKGSSFFLGEAFLTVI